MTTLDLLPATYAASILPLPYVRLAPPPPFPGGGSGSGADLGTTVYPDPVDARPGLSRRELQVLALVAEGMTNKEIGRQLYVSTNTINKHVGGVLIKLGARNRARAAAMYQQTQPVA